MTEPQVIEVGPQAGRQESFLSTPADIAIYGGSAGGGKTWALLLEPVRHIENPRFGATVFRRTYPQITEQGGMWEESANIYPYVGGDPSLGRLEWVFPKGAKVRFRHMQHEKTKYDYKGAQIPLIEWDQLEDFSETQFFYLLSRNRSTCGVRPYVRATCNPDPDSWLVGFLDWWLAEDGYPDLARAGKIRWFVRMGGQLEWADTKDELLARYGGLAAPAPDGEPEAGKEDGASDDGDSGAVGELNVIRPKSVTFIPATIYDNPLLMSKDPGYLANLLALDPVEQARLLGDKERGGNWRIRPEAGKVFNRSWFAIVDAVPAGGEEVRFWDFAATEKKLKGPEPAFTAGVKIRKVAGVYYVIDVVEEQVGPAEVDRIFENTCRQDAEAAKKTGTKYRVAWEEEGGSSGKRETWRMVKMLDGLVSGGVRPDGDKLTRAKPFAVQAKAGNVKVLRGPWNERYLVHLHNQPDIKARDLMDASSGAYVELSGESKSLIEFW
jgi:predicted phage terminase large subunit-like protein